MKNLKQLREEAHQLDELYNGIPSNAPLAGNETAADDTDLYLAPSEIGNPVVLDRLNAYVSRIGCRQYLNPSVALSNLREKLHRVGLIVEMPEYHENLLNGEVVTLPIRRFGGKIGLHPIEGWTNDADGFPDGGYFLELTVKKDRGMYMFDAEIVPGSEYTEEDEYDNDYDDYDDDQYDMEDDDLSEEASTEYQKFFKAALKKHGVSSPAEFKSEQEKKKFFDYVDKNYKAKSEVKEASDSNLKVVGVEINSNVLPKELQNSLSVMSKKDPWYEVFRSDEGSLRYPVKGKALVAFYGSDPARAKKAEGYAANIVSQFGGKRNSKTDSIAKKFAINVLKIHEASHDQWRTEMFELDGYFSEEQEAISMVNSLEKAKSQYFKITKVSSKENRRTKDWQVTFTISYDTTKIKRVTRDLEKATAMPQEEWSELITESKSLDEAVRRLKSDEQVELHLFVSNDRDLYNKYYMPFVKNTVKLIAMDRFDERKAEKALLNIVHEAARMYSKEFSTGNDAATMFTRKDRQLVAQVLLDEVKTEINFGNFDDLIPNNLKKSTPTLKGSLS